MKNFNITPALQQIFFTVVCFTLLSGGASIWLSTKDNLSQYCSVKLVFSSPAPPAPPACLEE